MLATRTAPSTDLPVHAPARVPGFYDAALRDFGPMVPATAHARLALRHDA